MIGYPIYRGGVKWIFIGSGYSNEIK